MIIKDRCEFNWPDILTRAKRTAWQAGVAALTAVPVADLFNDMTVSKAQTIGLAVGTAALGAGASVVWNAVSQYLECRKRVTARDILARQQLAQTTRYDEFVRTVKRG